MELQHIQDSDLPLDNFSPWATVTKGALHWINFLIKVKYSEENWFLMFK